eukprot:SM000175S03316  [mRNA]  locus=s175:236786:240025:+ [translate_table: standard]
MLLQDAARSGVVAARRGGAAAGAVSPRCTWPPLGPRGQQSERLVRTGLPRCLGTALRIRNGPVQILEVQVLDAYSTYGCYASVGSGAGYSGFKAQTNQLAASDAAMTTNQEATLGFPKLTLPQGLQSYSVLYNGVTALPLSCQSLADLYSGFFLSIGGGALTVAVVHLGNSGTSYVFSSYLNLCTASGPRPWPSTKVGENVVWGSTLLVAASTSINAALYVYSHPGSVAYLGNPVVKQGKKDRWRTFEEQIVDRSRWYATSKSFWQEDAVGRGCSQGAKIS